MRPPAKTGITTTRGFHAFLRCRTATVVPDLAVCGGIIGRHRASIRSGWRKLNPAQQGLLVLVYRDGRTATIVPVRRSGSAGQRQVTVLQTIPELMQRR